MNKLDVLKELAAKVEAGAKIYPSDLNNAWGLWSDEWKVCRNVMLAGDGSLDAAKALHEAVLPDFRWEIYDDGFVFVGSKATLAHRGKRATVDTNPARAWLLAILRALIAQEESA